MNEITQVLETVTKTGLTKIIIPFLVILILWGGFGKFFGTLKFSATQEDGSEIAVKAFISLVTKIIIIVMILILAFAIVPTLLGAIGQEELAKKVINAIKP
jgi:small-conductance mechanosensitive channel